MPLEHPARRKMRRPDQAGFVGMVSDRDKVEVDAVGLENDRGAADHQLADPAVAKPAADHDALGIAPALELEEAADDEREFLREVLDCPLHDAGCLGVAFGQQRVELLLADLIARLVAERIVAGLAQRLAPVLDDVAEGALAGAIADEAFIVARGRVVTVDLDRRQALAAVGSEPVRRSVFVRHGIPPRSLRQRESGGKVSYVAGISATTGSSGKVSPRHDRLRGERGLA